MGSNCKNVSSRPTGLFCSFHWRNSAYSPLLTTTTQLFPQSLPSHTFYSCLEILSTTNKVCNFGAASSNRSAPIRFPAGTIHLRQIGFAVLPIICAIATNPLPGCRAIPLEKEISTCLEGTIVKRLFPWK